MKCAHCHRSAPADSPLCAGCEDRRYYDLQDAADAKRKEARLGIDDWTWRYNPPDEDDRLRVTK